MHVDNATRNLVSRFGSERECSGANSTKVVGEDDAHGSRRGKGPLTGRAVGWLFDGFLGRPPREEKGRELVGLVGGFEILSPREGCAKFLGPGLANIHESGPRTTQKQRPPLAAPLPGMASTTPPGAHVGNMDNFRGQGTAADANCLAEMRG